jgi:hypothetical protein
MGRKAHTHMAFKSSFVTAAALGAMLLPMLPAQDVASIPFSRGVYYRGDSGWIGLTGNMLMPMVEGGAADFFSVGSRHAIIEIPGARATVQTTNVRPTLYVRGFSANTGIFLVKETQKQEYREIHMPVSRNFREFVHFRDKDLRAIEVQQVGNGLVSIKPMADLAAGEYAIVSAIDSNDRFLKIGYDFGVMGGPRK